jgi:hypothetical protein
MVLGGREGETPKAFRLLSPLFYQKAIVILNESASWRMSEESPSIIAELYPCDSVVNIS